MMIWKTGPAQGINFIRYKQQLHFFENEMDKK